MNRVMSKNVSGKETEVNRRITANGMIICTWACEKWGMDSSSRRSSAKLVHSTNSVELFMNLMSASGVVLLLVCS